jgi:hypothetical protein
MWFLISVHIRMKLARYGEVVSAADVQKALDREKDAKANSY